MRRASPAPHRPNRTVGIGKANPPSPDIVRRIEAVPLARIEGVGFSLTNKAGTLRLSDKAGSVRLNTKTGQRLAA